MQTLPYPLPYSPWPQEPDNTTPGPLDLPELYAAAPGDQACPHCGEIRILFLDHQPDIDVQANFGHCYSCGASWLRRGQIVQVYDVPDCDHKQHN